MNPDIELQKRVLEELEWDPAVPASDVGVSAKDGVITLSGHVENFAQKHAAGRAAQRVHGVKAIAVEINVRIAAAHRRSDTEIAQSIEDYLQQHVAFAADRVQVGVENGWITLNGELRWDYQRRMVDEAVRPLKGVTGVSNLIVLKPPVVAPEGISSRIKEALSRQALREAKRVEVTVKGSTVTLCGRVHSWKERNAAQGAAWSAPGVATVINELVVD